MDCIFCKIAGGEVPSDILHQDDRVIVIRDINPQAPVHLLIMPREHIASLRDIDDANASLMGHMALVANQMAEREGVAEKGYRLAINCGDEGGQTVGHLHAHLLGGRQLSGRLG
ncbi:MAG: histidine triad nucleotide-binding protein [Chloroflexi bacterium]|nr:histidine triad nucleotide-binding protein [Chloroflexota bacterium]